MIIVVYVFVRVCGENASALQWSRAEIESGFGDWSIYSNCPSPSPDDYNVSSCLVSLEIWGSGHTILYCTVRGVGLARYPSCEMTFFFDFWMNGLGGSELGCWTSWHRVMITLLTTSFQDALRPNAIAM